MGRTFDFLALSFNFFIQLSHLLWSSLEKSFACRIKRKYLESFTSSLSVCLLMWACLKGLILRPLLGFITKFLLKSSNMMVFSGPYLPCITSLCQRTPRGLQSIVPYFSVVTEIIAV